MTQAVGAYTAMQQRIGGPYSYRPLGYQQLAATASAQNLPSIPAGATMALINVSGGAIRYRDDQIAPTSALGMIIGSGEQFQYAADLINFMFITQNSNPVLDILYYM